MRSRQQGYVLIMVMAALALLAIIALRVAGRVDRLRAQQQLAERKFEQDKQAIEAWHAALYAVLVSHSGPAGWGEVRADGRLYELLDGVRVRVQDDRGLLSVNMPERALWLPVLRSLGEELQSAEVLLDVLADYADTDSLRRLNGAEADEYRAMGLPPPRNDWLVTGAELARMPKWRERAPLRASLEPWLTTGLLPQINPNTAPVALMKALYSGQAAELWTQFEMERNRQPFFSATDVALRTGLQLPEDRHVYFTGLRLSVAIWPSGATLGLQYNLNLLPRGQLAPYLVSSVQPVALPSPDHLPHHVTALPLEIDLQPRP